MSTAYFLRQNSCNWFSVQNIAYQLSDEAVTRHFEQHLRSLKEAFFHENEFLLLNL
jgi:hypothetical protein